MKSKRRCSRLQVLALTFVGLFYCLQAVAAGYTIVNLGTLGGSSSAAEGININGYVVGNSFVAADTTTHAFLYGNGEMIDIGTLGGTFGEAYSINSNGWVVGLSSTASNAAHAFVYSNGVMNDLGTLGGTSSGAQGINNNGQVVGSSYLAGDVI